MYPLFNIAILFILIIEKSRDEPTYSYLFFLEPRMENWMQDVEERIQHGVDLGKKSGFIKSGQPIVCITGKEIEIIQRLFIKVS